MLCTDAGNGKMRPAEAISGIGELGGKCEWWMRWIQLWYIVRTIVTSQCTPQCNNMVKN
jgi:hypothetical protein